MFVFNSAADRGRIYFDPDPTISLYRKFKICIIKFTDII